MVVSNKLPFNLGDYIKNKKSNMLYRVNGVGRIRATGEWYLILDDNSLLRKKEWSKYELNKS